MSNSCSNEVTHNSLTGSIFKFQSQASVTLNNRAPNAFLKRIWIATCWIYISIKFVLLLWFTFSHVQKYFENSRLFILTISTTASRWVGDDKTVSLCLLQMKVFKISPFRKTMRSRKDSPEFVCDDTFT